MYRMELFLIAINSIMILVAPWILISRVRTHQNTAKEIASFVVLMLVWEGALIGLLVWF